MFVRRKTVRGKTYFALVENRRVDGKVKQRIVASLGDSPDPMDTIMRLRAMAEFVQSHSDIYKRKWVRLWEFRYSRNGGQWSDDTEVFRDGDWEKELEAGRAKAAEFLRIAAIVEEFAKRGLSEEEWTAKLDAAEKARAEREKLFQQRFSIA